MSEDANTMDFALPTRVRIHLSRPANWLQLVRFAVVGASGYVVNLAVFAFVVHVLKLDYHVTAPTLAFILALANNFFWNRHWTFRAGDGHAGWQAARFIGVSLVGFGFALLVLQVLLGVGLPKISAQALAIAAATPLNFLGNRLWSFRT
ncbi:MAG TPA: GtrA family protein [Solirubrobacteraceae bacterium]|nr:GtrA family protein [Solirubrobacteraceae bacterium]